MTNICTLAAAIMLGLGIQAACAADIKPLNSVLMEVNSSIITYGDVSRTVRELKSRPTNKDIPEAQLVQAAKMQLVERSLLADAARQQQLRVPEAGIDEELQRRAAQDKTTVAALYAKAASVGYTKESYRLEVAKDLLIAHMLSNLNSDINITEAQIQEYAVNAQKTGQALPAAEPYTVYIIRRILLRATSQADVPAVGNRIQQIATAIAQGTDFASIARRYSQEAQAANGGLHDNITDYMLPENVEPFLHTLKVGEVSAPRNAGTTWQMIELVGSRTETDPYKMQAEAIRRLLVRQAQQRNQEAFIGQLQQSAVVREY